MELKVLKNILNANDQIAEKNRRLFREKRVLVINLMASPGAGKTTFIMKTIEVLKGKAEVGVIEGDVSSCIDTQKLSEAGIEAIQINTTGGACHLDASMINTAISNLPLERMDILFIENVGNLICPGDFDLGENIKLLVSSTPEGHDKPYKYPLLFTFSDDLVLSKTDLLPYVSFDTQGFEQAVRGINQKTEIFKVSGLTGDGMDRWAEWLLDQLQTVKSC